MKAKLLVSTAFLAASVSLSAQKSATITVHADQGKEIIPKEIYGQFAEFLLLSSLKRLSIFSSPTSVGLRYGQFQADA